MTDQYQTEFNGIKNQIVEITADVLVQVQDQLLP